MRHYVAGNVEWRGDILRVMLALLKSMACIKKGSTIPELHLYGFHSLLCSDVTWLLY